jgi:two-component system cell cycle response regulator
MVIKILVVEDDVSISKTFVEFLTKSGFETTTAVSAEAAELILNIEEMDIVITDIVLPGIDGIQFTKNVRKRFNTEVIVMTGYSSEYSYEDAIKSGASDLIFKPIKLNELVLRINRVLRERFLLDQRDEMIKQLQRLTIEDPLTGLFNSRYLFDQLDKEINRAKRYLHPLSLMFIDIDKFKTINDTYGHMMGDKVLLQIANRLKDCLRSNDTAYRFGGDEYTIILPETTLPEAKYVADRIINKFDHDSLIINGKDISKISLSIGITEYQINEGIEQLLHRADVTMFEAKQREGNSMVITPDLGALAVTNLPQPSLSH